MKKKKHISKKEIRTPKNVNVNTANKTNENSSNKRLLSIIIALLAIVLYANTIVNDYAFDDLIVITRNSFVKEGVKGIPDLLTKNYLAGMYGKQMTMYEGGRYRPLSLVTFAIEYQFFGANPHINHLINMLLYALTGVLLFLTLLKLLPDKSLLSMLKNEENQNNTSMQKLLNGVLSIPFIATILYISHPLHTEVVANIKGRDEIMTFIGSLLTLWFSLKYIDTLKSTKTSTQNKPLYLIYIFVIFFLALLSKENAITFVAIIPLTIYFFRNTSKAKVKHYIHVIAPMLLATILFLSIRQQIINATESQVDPNLMTSPFLGADLSQKYATIAYTLGLYIKLLFFPHPLTFDYYPNHIPLIGWLNLKAIIPLLVYGALLAYAIYGLKKRNLIAYSLWFYFATFSIVSNIVFPIGVFMSERFMYISSLGFCIIIAYLLIQTLPSYLQKQKVDLSQYKPRILILITIIVFLFSLKTITRNTEWKDNFTLFTTDVKKSPNSLKSTAAAGEILLLRSRKPENKEVRKEYLRLSIEYFTTTVKVYPEYIYALIYLGEGHFEYNQDYEKSVGYYKRVLKLRPGYDKVYLNIENMFKYVNDIDYKIQVYTDLFEINKKRYEINYQLGILYGVYKNNLPKSIFYLERAVKFNPKSDKAFADLGVAYGRVGNFKNALQMLLEAHKLKPNDLDIITNISTAYQQLGDKTNASIFANKAARLKK